MCRFIFIIFRIFKTDDRAKLTCLMSSIDMYNKSCSQMFLKLESNNKIFKQLKFAETLMTNRSKSFF